MYFNQEGSDVPLGSKVALDGLEPLLLGFGLSHMHLHNPVLFALSLYFKLKNPVSSS